jgi:hypothetical protein
MPLDLHSIVDVCGDFHEKDLNLLILWRGAPGWWSKQSEHQSGSSGGNQSGQFSVALEFGGIRLSASYDANTQRGRFKGTLSHYRPVPM